MRSGRRPRRRIGQPGGVALLVAAAITVVVAIASCAGGAGEPHPRAGSTSPSPAMTISAGESPTSASPAPTSAPRSVIDRAATDTPSRTAAEPRATLAGKVIVLDPGHNGDNARHLSEISKPVNAGGFEKPCNTEGTGTAGGYSEATFNWEVAKLLAAKLRASDAKVILTRPSNTGWGPCIDERGLIADRNHADLLLSIHADGSLAAYRGFYLMSPARRRGYTGTTAAPSRRAAVAVRDAMVASGFRPADYVASRGLWLRSDLGTLNRAGTPAIMIECGNMRNPRDAATMTSRAGRAKIAAALYDGIVRYLRRAD